MINGKRLAVVLPAYNAQKTLEATVRELPDVVDIRILVDDGSSDATAALARTLGLQTFVHNRNYGYGRNQMTCYRKALYLEPRHADALVHLALLMEQQGQRAEAQLLLNRASRLSRHAGV